MATITRQVRFSSMTQRFEMYGSEDYDRCGYTKKEKKEGTITKKMVGFSCDVQHFEADDYDRTGYNFKMFKRVVKTRLRLKGHKYYRYSTHTEDEEDDEYTLFDHVCQKYAVRTTIELGDVTMNVTYCGKCNPTF
jgi:hypothetical protein